MALLGDKGSLSFNLCKMSRMSRCPLPGAGVGSGGGGCVGEGRWEIQRRLQATTREGVNGDDNSGQATFYYRAAAFGLKAAVCDASLWWNWPIMVTLARLEIDVDDRGRDRVHLDYIACYGCIRATAWWGFLKPTLFQTWAWAHSSASSFHLKFPGGKPGVPPTLTYNLRWCQCI